VSWLGDLGGLAGSLDAPGAADYARGAIISSAARAGWSANQALAQLRSVGLGVRRADFLRTYAQTREAIAASQTAQAVPLGQLPAEAIAGAAPEGWTGQYVHQVTATYRSTGEQGETVLTTRTLGIKSSNLLNPFEASQAALGLVEAPIEPEAESRYGGIGNLVSLSLTGTWYSVGGGLGQAVL